MDLGAAQSVKKVQGVRRPRNEEKWFNVLGDAIDSIPSIYYLWSKAQKYVEIKDKKNILRYQNLIMLLHNSSVSPYCKLGEDV